jgi:hypothetical protein
MRMKKIHGSITLVKKKSREGGIGVIRKWNTGKVETGGSWMMMRMAIPLRIFPDERLENQKTGHDRTRSFNNFPRQ